MKTIKSDFFPGGALFREVYEPQQWSNIALRTILRVRVIGVFVPDRTIIIKYSDLNIDREQAEKEYHNDFNTLRDRLVIYFEDINEKQKLGTNNKLQTA